MWWAVAASAGLAGLQGLSEYDAASKKSKAAKKWQEYSNTMTNLNDAVNQNAITTNEILAMQASTLEAVDIKKVNLVQQAEAEAFAAAAGVRGRSVNQSMLNLNRNAATAQRNRQTRLRNQFLAFDQQRVQSKFSAALNQDYSFIPEPKAGNILLGAASAGLSTYAALSPQGSRGSGVGASTPGIPRSGVSSPKMAGAQPLYS